MASPSGFSIPMPLNHHSLPAYLLSIVLTVFLLCLVTLFIFITYFTWNRSAVPWELFESGSPPFKGSVEILPDRSISFLSSASHPAYSPVSLRHVFLNSFYTSPGIILHHNIAHSLYSSALPMVFYIFVFLIIFLPGIPIFSLTKPYSLENSGLAMAKDMM